MVHFAASCLVHDVSRITDSEHIFFSIREAKLYKGSLQVATSKFGSYKKIGEDTFPFSEVPKWSEYQWVQDPHNRNMLVSLLFFFRLCVFSFLCHPQHFVRYISFVKTKIKEKKRLCLRMTRNNNQDMFPSCF